MAVILSPWPSDTAPLALATSTLKDAVEPGASDAKIQRLGAVAAALTERYAPKAPQEIRNESVTRFSGYQAESSSGGFGATRSDKLEVDGLGRDTQYVVNHAAMFRNCGAAGLLSPWRIRRAGAIDSSDASTASTASTTQESTMPAQQLSSIELTENPVNIADGLAAGSYEFQVSAESNASAIVLYSYGDTAPSELSQYFTARYPDRISFQVVSGTRLWCRVRSNNLPATVAIARV